MKMEVLAVQQQYQSKYNIYGSSKVRDWTSTLSPLLPLSSCVCMDTEPEMAAAPQPTASIPIPYLQNQQNYHISNQNDNNKYNRNNSNNTVNNKNVKNSIMHHNNKKTKRTASTEELLAVPEVMIAPPSSKEVKKMPASRATSAPTPFITTPNTNTATPTVGGSYLTTQHTPSQHPSANLFNCDDIDAAAVDDLSLRLLDELRAAKQRHLSCTEVSLPCDLTLRIAAEIIRVSEKEPCGIRGCTIYIEFEDEPNNSRRIAELKLDPEMVSTFEIYLTLRQDHRGWTSLLPQFMKSLARTITISPTFTITKHKLYSPDRTSYSFTSCSNGASGAISTPTS
ncbi:protein scylla [Anastrepha obliqua]|uniref:protein scylla n=1 Tax=Anastrepha ludens TaxID=28586 RepID=UPI0023AEB27C|nr:protein scylla [Anastrepha ludens]XP_054731752.1 protein scylla [Anastrepha obliqua]